MDRWNVNEWLYGLDISNYQAGLKDFHAVARAGFNFTFILASDGEWKQPYFRDQLAGARDAGLLTAAYHYQRDNVTAARQVQVITEQVPAGVPVVIDVEDGSGRGDAGVNLTRAIVAGLRERGYTVPLVYIPRWFWAAPADSPHGGLAYASLAGLPPLWVSWYPDYVTRSKEIGAEQLPGTVWNGYGGLGVAVVQFTSSGSVPGYAGAVDQNTFRGTRAEFAALLGGQGDEDMAAADDVLFNRLIVGPDGPTRYNLNTMVYWTNFYANLIPLLMDAVNAQGTVLAQLAEHDDRIELAPEQLELLRSDLVERVESATRDSVAALEGELAQRLDAFAQALADRLGQDKQTVLEALREFYRPAVDAPAFATAASEANRDGLRGGAAAPEGIGGPTADDTTGSELE